MDGIDDAARRLPELNFRRRQHGELLVSLQLLFGCNELYDVDATEIPAVRVCAFLKLLTGLRERDIYAPLTVAGALE